MVKYLQLLAIVLTFNSTAYSQLTENYTDFLEEMLTTIETDFNPIGLSIAVIQGEDEWSSAIGISYETDSLNTEHLLAAGSISKTFISACILSMMEDGLLALNDPLGMYLPNYENIDSSVTLNQLLNHSSGIYNYTNHPEFFNQVLDVNNLFRVYEPSEVLEGFVLEPVFDKGTFQEYSNTNYVLLGMIISEITGRPYYEEISERFDLPNKYPTISIAPYHTDPFDLADLWADTGAGTVNLEELGLGLVGMFSSAGAAGAYVGTPTDIARWGYDLYSGKILKNESLELMATTFDGQKNGYGLGTVVGDVDCGVFTLGHSGGIIYSANLFYAPEHDLAVVAMTNDGNGIVEADGVIGITYEMLCNYKLLVNTEELKEEGFSVNTYPNPVKDDLQLEISGMGPEVCVELFSYEGQRLSSWTMRQNKMLVDLPVDLNPGIFYLKVSDDTHSVTRKVIKL